MAAPHAPNPVAGNPRTPPAGSIFDFLLALLRQAPPWLRAVVVLGIFTAVGLGVYHWITAQSPASKPQAVPQPQYPLTNGRQVDAAGNANEDPRNQSATQRISDDDEHFKWHATHETHEPDWTLISRVDDGNLLEYKYYKDTDHCVLLLRKQNGDANTQWIRESVFARRSAKENEPKVRKSIINLADILVGTAYASPQDPSAPGGHLEPVQMGCVNPHPGIFQWWWGPPSDQCWSPMYRRFSDGCTHHQMFNRCYNTWDPNIWWDYCTGNPQHY
jgi:hypothetical protein